MLPDFTPEIALDDRGSKAYKILRPVLYGGAFLAGLYVASLVLFPSQYFTFDFLNANSSKNTLLNPRSQENAPLDHGRFPEENSVTFFAPVTEKYSSAEISFTLSKKSAPLTSTEVKLKRSFQAFFYPEGDSLDLKNASLFEVGGNKYLLEDETLRPFLSDQAYSSHFDHFQLISRPEDFLKTYPMSERKIGFADGTLLSSPDSIFIVSDGKILPIDSQITFLSSGFFWEDVIAASSDELAFYEKGKLFTLNVPHPDGTVFFASDENMWYLVKDGQKMKLPSRDIMLSRSKKIPVNVSGKSLETSATCQLQKKLWPRHSYSCRIALENLENFPGKDFRFETLSSSEIKVDAVSARFVRDINYENFLFSASTFLNRIKNNYAPIQ